MTLRSMTVLVLALTVGPAVAVPAAAQQAETMYTRALARERVLRDEARHPTLKQLRAAIASYEAIVRRFPRSGYSDNALWQGANLSLFAYEKFGQAVDRRRTVRLATQLRDGYPSSSLVSRVGEVLRQTERVLAQKSAPRSASPVVPALLERSPVREASPDPAPSPSLVTIRGITRSQLPGGAVRVSIEMDGESSYRAETLERPSRVFFDLKGTQTVSSLQDATLTFADPLVREIRLGRHPNHTTRIVMDMQGTEGYSVFTLYDPFRLVIDFAPSASALAASAPAAAAPAVPVGGPAAPVPTVPAPAAPPPPDAAPAAKKAVEAAADLKPLPSRAVVAPSLSSPALPSANADGKFSLARQLGLGISRIVIDAGHGGHDPGTDGHGIQEAELVLDVAQRLSKLLKKQAAIDVVMTRDSDVFIPLEERTAIANREGADLFLSIHANAARNSQARGIETYFLNFASNPEAEAVAARENSASARTMHSLPDIVRAIALNNKIDESRDFAATVQRAMVRRLSARNRQLQNRGVKQAPFVVLTGAAMPSALAEISFLTNRQEAQLLKTGAYRQQIAEALYDAVIQYQQSLKKIKSASTKVIGAR